MEPGVVCGVSSQTVVITDPFLGGRSKGGSWESLGGNHWGGIAAVTSFLNPNSRYAPGRPTVKTRWYYPLRIHTKNSSVIGEPT